MIKALIIDDETHCVQRLQRLVEENAADHVAIIGNATSVENGIASIRQFDPDLVFLDVQLHDQSGFDLLEQLGEKNFGVIFTTAYEKYAVRAFRFSALDYLLKPIDAEDLVRAIQKVSAAHLQKDTADKLDALLHNFRNVHGSAKRIAVPVSSGLEFITVGDIIRCESSINYTTIFLQNKQQLLVAKTLKEFDELLGDYNFFRVHNSHLVNLSYIKNFNKGKGGYVTMTDGAVVEVSTRRKDQFLKRLGN